MKRCANCGEPFAADKFHPYQRYCSPACCVHACQVRRGHLSGTRPYRPRWLRSLECAA